MSRNGKWGVIGRRDTPISLPTSGGMFTLNEIYNTKLDGPPFTIDYLVIGGGGGGGRSNGGGGGAGGVLTGIGVLVSGNYTVTVGAGGALTTSSSINGGLGQNSVLSGSEITVTAIGGGGGGSETSSTEAGSGGSGGGGNGYATTNARYAGLGTAGPPIQGYNGGQSTGRLTGYLAGGGGGAGRPGGNSY